MKQRRITLGIGYSDYWNNHRNFESDTHALLHTVKEQNVIIQAQKRDIEKIKTIVAELRLRLENCTIR